LTYAYNNLGQKTSITSGSYGVQYSYYANGWLKEVRAGTQVLADYRYDAVGNRTQMDYGNTTYTSYTYDTDPRYRVSDISHYRQGTPPTLLGEISYTQRDGAGNPRQMVDWNGTTSYNYDANSRLDDATYPGQSLTDFNYDWVGNRRGCPKRPSFPALKRDVGRLNEHKRF
jgi:hypothetical protein